MIEKRQNEANLLVALTIDILRLRTNKGEIEQEKRTHFPAGGKGRGAGEQVPGERCGQTTFPGRQQVASRVRRKDAPDAERCVIASSTHPALCRWLNILINCRPARS